MSRWRRHLWYKYNLPNDGTVFSCFGCQIVKKDKLKPGKVRFTISEDGTISKAILVSTSGYPSIDKHMTKLITEAPGKWEAATDGNGNQVEEQLVFSFGIVGC